MDIAELLTRERSASGARGNRPIDAPVVMDARVVTGSGGGPDKTILNTPRFLHPLGYRMVCAYLHPPDDGGYAVIERMAERYGAPLISIPDRGPWDWRILSRLHNVCRQENVAIWHGHDYKTNALGLLLKRFWPMRLVTTVHGWVHRTSRTPFYYKLDQLCLPRYERVLCVSDDLLQTCISVGVPAKNCILLENGIDADEFSRKQDVGEARVKLGLPQSGFVVGSVGRLEPEKGFDLLIRSVHALIQRGLDVRLVLVGDGSERENLARLVAELGMSDRVLFTGWKTEVRDYFEAMDLFVLASLREGLPNVLLEAMALEVPIVATRVNGVPRLIQDGRNGFLVDPGNGEGLTTAIGGLLKNQALREIFSRSSRHIAKTRYSFTVRIDRLKRIYDELLSC